MDANQSISRGDVQTATIQTVTIQTVTIQTVTIQTVTIWTQRSSSNLTNGYLNVCRQRRLEVEVTITCRFESDQELSIHFWRI